MKIFALAALTATATLALAGEVTLKIGGTAGLKGTAKLTNKLQEDGSKYVRMEMELRSADGQIATVLQESVYDKTGMPVRMIQNTESKGAKTQKIVASFSLGSVHIRVTDDGKSRDESLTIPAGISITAKYEFWFVRDKPAPGGKTAYHRFDLQTTKWERVEVVYHGTRTITVDGKTVKAHLIELGDTRAYVDDAGDPYRIEMPGILLERTS
jgi:hypothetical protein